MNKVTLIGRLTKDPQVGNTSTPNQDGSQGQYARYSLAVDRRRRTQDPNEQTTDFINCVAFGAGASFAAKYLKKGTKIAIVGRIRSGKYVNQDGQTVYTTDVVVEEQEFCEPKRDPSQQASYVPQGQTAGYTPAQQSAAQNYAPQTQPGNYAPAQQPMYAPQTGYAAQKPAQAPVQNYMPQGQAYAPVQGYAQPQPAAGGYAPAANKLPDPQPAPGNEFMPLPASGFSDDELPFA